MKPVDFAFAAARESREALSLLAGGGDGAKFIGGGQSLGPMLNLRLARPNLLVEVARATDLRGATEEGGAVVYGAAVTHAEIEDGDVPDATPGWLPAVARNIAYRAVRNRGTIGGSLVHADPAADWVVTLTAMGADAILVGPGGRRVVGLADFILGPFATALEANEIVTGIRVPKRGPGARWGYWKFTRKLGEFAQASAAVLVDPDRGETRVVVGATEGRPVALPDPDGLLAAPGESADRLAAALPGRAPETLALHVAALRRAIAIAAGARPEEAR